MGNFMGKGIAPFASHADYNGGKEEEKHPFISMPAWDDNFLWTFVYNRVAIDTYFGFCYF